MIQIAVLLTCYNRRQKTETCLHSFFTAIRDVRGYSFTVFLTDDGSTDGTSDSIKRLFPHVQVIAGQGNLFWAGGMRLAWNKALHSGLFIWCISPDQRWCGIFAFFLGIHPFHANLCFENVFKRRYLCFFHEGQGDWHINLWRSRVTKPYFPAPDLSR